MSDSMMVFAGKDFDPTNRQHAERLLRLTGELPAPLPGGGWARPAKRAR